MTKYVIHIAYDGSKYHGLQKIPGKRTVQGELESILSKLDGEHVKVYSAGRTDRGVHALDQVCSFSLTRVLTPYKLKGYINRSTSKYLHVISCEVCSDVDFHPRFDVTSKTYKYIINTKGYDPIKEDYLYNYNDELDVDAIRACAHAFIGPHNFRAFIVGKHETYETIVDSIDISENDGLITIRVKGKSFYTYMVRYIVAGLILAGAKRIEALDIETMLKTGVKMCEFAPLPPSGLYLEKIEY